MSNQNDYTRREFLALGAIVPAGWLLTQTAVAESHDRSKEILLYVGTYTSNTKSEGIYVCGFNSETGKLTQSYTVKGVADPSFLTVDKKYQNLYAVNELVDFEGKASGSVSAFAIDKKTGNLNFLNKQATLGGAPCHLTASDNGKFLLVANYVGGNISVLPIQNKGMLGPVVDVVQHVGSGPNKERQLAPHAHSITLDTNNRFAFAADLGTDKLMIYEFDAKTGKLKPNGKQPFFQTKPGAGPRHFAFHPKGNLAFLINELDSTLTSLAYSRADGTLTEIQTKSTLSKGYAGPNTCADVHVSPDGKYVYGSNRGSDTVVTFRVDEKTGKIEYVENTSTGGRKPRNFAIDPTGNFLLAANQDTDDITVFRIERATGHLTPTGNTASIPAPVCLKFGPVRI